MVEYNYKFKHDMTEHKMSIVETADAVSVTLAFDFPDEWDFKKGKHHLIKSHKETRKIVITRAEKYLRITEMYKTEGHHANCDTLPWDDAVVTHDDKSVYRIAMDRKDQNDAILNMVKYFIERHGSVLAGEALHVDGESICGIKISTYKTIYHE